MFTFDTLGISHAREPQDYKLYMYTLLQNYDGYIWSYYNYILVSLFCCYFGYHNNYPLSFFIIIISAVNQNTLGHYPTLDAQMSEFGTYTPKISCPSFSISIKIPHPLKKISIYCIWRLLLLF